MEYDVFISCKSEDYKLAEEVYDFLTSNGIHTFLSTKELRRMKDSEYMDAISEALDSAYHLIVIATCRENVLSKWVKFEWTTFLNEKLSDRKEGQIMTLLTDMPIKDLPIQLRSYESFSPEDYRERLLPYVETPSYLIRKDEERKKKEEEEKRQKAIEAEKKRVAKIQKEIEEREEDYFVQYNGLEAKVEAIIEKKKSIGDHIKVCPVCETEAEIDDSYCKKCGWTFIPRFSSHQNILSEHLFLLQSNWISVGKSSKDSKEIIRLSDSLVESEKKIDEYEKLITSIKEQLELEESKNHDLENENSKTTLLLQKRNEEWTAIQNEKEEELKKIHSQYDLLKNQVEEVEKTKRKVEEELLYSQRANEKLDNEFKVKVKDLEDRLKDEKDHCSSLKQKITELEDKIKKEEETKQKNNKVLGQPTLYSPFSSKEDVATFLRKFCSRLATNKTTYSELKLNVDSLIKHLADDYGIIVEKSELQECRNFIELKKLIYNKGSK